MNILKSNFGKFDTKDKKAFETMDWNNIEQQNRIIPEVDDV